MLGLLGGAAINGMMDEDPRRQGLLSAALAGLAASGPSNKPVSFGQTLGQAGMQGMQSMRDAEQFGMARDMKNLQMEQMRFQQQKMQEDMAKQAQQRQAQDQYAATLPPEQQAEFRLDPPAYMQRSKPMTVGRSIYNPVTKKFEATDPTVADERQARFEEKQQELAQRHQQQLEIVRMQNASREQMAALQRQQQREMFDLRAQLAGDRAAANAPKPPTGYRYRPDNTLEPIPGGPADPATKTGPDGMPKITEGQGKANLYKTRADEANKIISDLEGKFSPMAINAKNAAGKVWGVGPAIEGTINLALSDENQMAEQAQRNFMNAVLRLESGAVIGAEEFENGKRQYFPQPGDSKQVIAQKRKNRETAIRGLEVMSGPASTMNNKTSGASGGWGSQSGGVKFLGFE